MKIPSRFMPKYIEKKAGVLGWTFIALLISFALYLIYKFPATVLFIPIFIAVEIINSKKRKAYFLQLKHDREGNNLCTFARYFEVRKIDTWVIRAVYEQLQNYLKSETHDFPILPNDDVFKVLKIDEEDFELNIVEEIAQRTGRSLEHVESNPYYGKANIVENIVYFFNEQPKIT